MFKPGKCFTGRDSNSISSHSTIVLPLFQFSSKFFTSVCKWDDTT